jgi:hypothetical protein
MMITAGAAVYCTDPTDNQLNLVRCLFGAVGTAVIQLLYNAIGAGWTMVLLTGLCLVALPLPAVVWLRGAKWRARRDAKDELVSHFKEPRRFN